MGTDLDQFSFFFLRFTGLPVFLEMHGVKKDSIFLRSFLRSACGIIGINQRIKNYLTETYGVTDGRILVEPNGIDLDYFTLSLSPIEARKKLHIEEYARIILYAGKFYDWKGIEVLIPAARMLEKDIRILLVGGSKEELENILGGVELPSNIICVGHRPYKEIPLWLAAADALLLLGTKKNDYSYTQTSPMKLFEYMASRRPILASDTPAIREIVSDDETYMYEPDNGMDLGNKINGILEDKNANSRIARAYEKVKHYTWEKRSLRIIEFIHACQKG